MHTWTEAEAEETAVVVMSKYVEGLPGLKPAGGGGPALLVVSVVLPALVTSPKVTVTGLSWTLTFAPTAVLSKLSFATKASPVPSPALPPKMVWKASVVLGKSVERV